MKKQKINYQTEEQKEMIKFGIVMLVVIFIIVGVYFLSKALIKPEVEEYAYQTGTVSTDTVIVGTMLKKPESEYYVLAYDENSDFANAYLTYANYYKNSTKATKIYYLNLNHVFNKEYFVTENSNPKAKTIKELKMIDGTLIKIQKGKIVKYLEGITDISKELKVEKE